MYKKLHRKFADYIWISSQDKKIWAIPNIIKIFIISIKNFKKNSSYLRASSLTYYTLLSIVPIFALAFAICKGFGLESKLYAAIYSRMQGHENVLNKVMIFSNNLLSKTHGSVIAGVGILILIWSVIKLFTNIESSFNKIWDIHKNRNFYRKITDYLFIAIATPILLIISSSLIVYMNTSIAYLEDPKFKIIISTLLSQLFVWGLFFLLFKILPNCKVNTRPSAVAGIGAGIFFSIVQFFYFNIQIILTRYNAIYGSFAALPLFLVWIQINWIIVLFGTEVSHTIQNLENIQEPHISPLLSFSQKKVLSLLLTHHIVKNFKNGNAPLTSENISSELDIQLPLTREILKNLCKAGIICQTFGENELSTAYLPSKDIEHLTLINISRSIEHTDEIELNLKNEHISLINKALETLNDLVKDSKHNIPIDKI